MVQAELLPLGWEASARLQRGLLKGQKQDVILFIQAVQIQQFPVPTGLLSMGFLFVFLSFSFFFVLSSKIIRYRLFL